MKSTIYISRLALQSNFRAVQSVVGDDVEVLAVVKANAYGHGATICAPLLVEAGANWLGVSDVEEGAAVRRAVGPTPRILVMCGLEPRDEAEVLRHNLSPVVWTPQHIRHLEQAAAAAHTTCFIHLEIDTGMARQGTTPGQALAETLAELIKSPHLVCEGVMSHFCCAESADATVTQQQSKFAAAVEQVCTAGIKPAFLHLCNSPAVNEGSTTPFIRELAKTHGARSMVRTGLALYGHLLPSNEPVPHAGELSSRIEPVLTWKTRVIGLREISSGTAVGYGATFTAAHPMRLALLPVGYADGFRRAASSGVGNGWVVLAGTRAPVVGRVSMNLTVADVTHIAKVDVGDEVVLLGEGVSAEDHACWSNTIAYDILCGVHGRHFVQ